MHEKKEKVWSQLEKLPYRNTPQDAAQRKKIFDYVDVNSNGYLSLAEVDKGIRDVLKISGLFQLKPVLIRAFTVAKNRLPTHKSFGDDYVSRAEFRFLLLYLRQYYQYWIAFQDIDKDHSRRISKEEFKAAIPILKNWSVNVENVDKVFSTINKGVGNNILFADFCDWAINQNLDIYNDKSIYE